MRRVLLAVAIVLAILPADACAELTGPMPELGVAEGVRLHSVVDGDTIRITLDGELRRVRLIGVDAPELGRNGASDECYAQEATVLLESLLAGDGLELRADSSQGDADRYGRLLRHVFVGDSSAAVGLLAAGAAREYTYDEPYAGYEAHRAAEAAAIEARAGLWGAC